jgi:hypothetical protein
MLEIDKTELDLNRGQLMLSFMNEADRNTALAYLETFLNPYQIADANDIAKSTVLDRMRMDIAIRELDAEHQLKKSQEKS